jgi:cAMP-binding proteins - catabolite gene activator and regulatory subunit of cAMP-dependent protein kinases
MTEAEEKTFDSGIFLKTVGPGKTFVHRKAKDIFFSQGEEADSVFYLRSGRAKLTVVSKKGKEATVTLLGVGDFFGEESMSGEGTRRFSTASAITVCSTTRIASDEMLHVIHEEHTFSDFFMQFILKRSIRTHADLVDQLFNSSERRLARILLIMAEYGGPGAPEAMIPEVTQEALAEMIGSTRSCISFFMNRFRKLGYIEYDGYRGRIRVHKSLLNVVLRDELPEENASRPKLIDPSTRKALL